MDCITPGLPIHHQLPELAQTHVRWVNDAIQPSHLLSSPSPPAFSLSQHQGLFQWVSSSHQVAKVLEFQLQHQSFQWIFRTDFFEDWLVDLLAVQGTLKSLLQHHSLKFTDPHCISPKSPKCLTSYWLKPGLWSLCSDHLLCFKSSPLQCFCLENPMDWGAWRAAVHGVAEESDTTQRLHFHFHFSLSCIGEGNGSPLRCSCLENPRDGEAW